MTPDFSSYDWIVVNSSAGKDSQAMLDRVVELVPAELRARIVVVHADLGRVEWKGTRELAEEQAKHYGARFEVVQRTQNDLLDHVRARGMWPSSTARYCTSEHKRGPISTLFTRLAKEKQWGVRGEQIRILNCLGMRAQESSARAKLCQFENDKRNTNGRRLVDRWLPIFAWKADDVWARIKQSGVRHHWAYDLGMPRLSCAFCIFAPEAALVLAGKYNPALLDEYIAVENETGHTFRANLSLKAIKVKVERGTPVEPVKDWTM